MTQLELFEDRAYRRRGMSRFGAVRALRYLIATLFASWQARVALARLVRSRQGRIEDVPAHLRRDIGLPDVDPAPWRSTMIILLYLRLK